MPITITIPEGEFWDEKQLQFVYSKEQSVTFEHSLVSISKWESKWHIPFLSKEEKTQEQTLDYIKCMTITQNVKDETYSCLSQENVKELTDYINNPMTAAWFSGNQGRNNRIITSEVMYYYMIELGIPMECQRWHINRLFTLMKVINEERKDNKMSTNELYRRNSELNRLRKQRLGIKN